MDLHLEWLTEFCHTSSDHSEDKISSGSPLGPSEGYSLNQKIPTVFIRPRDEEDPSGSNPMPTFDPADLIGKTFLLPPEENGRGIEPRLPERLSKSLTKKMVTE